MKRGLLIILSGPSGVGKGTIRKQLFQDYPELNLSYSISFTTRSPRENEIDGVDYFFISSQHFDLQINKKNLLEYAEFVGNKYGTPKDLVMKQLDQGKSVLLEIEVNGAKQVLKNFQNDNIVSFFITSSLEQIKERITNRRTESAEIINERLQKAKQEMDEATLYDYIIPNNTVEQATQEIATLIKTRLEKINQ